jgi:hypothetical protein
MRDKWDEDRHKEEHKAQHITNRFFFRQFLMNMQRYDEVVDSAPSKDILMTDMVYSAIERRFLQTLQRGKVRLMSMDKS